ncbi:RecX family transcriptional regulator [uncultured Faecalicoccus sp.]|uniref:glycosyltransferase n=1 Tax=uncultured Faecalicoccus sp. TaxID=1971760 RepID=UPI002637D3E4|nr:RecX family transcriptional regulator [uncultured Faecalicoccus sp.]
MNIGLFTDAYLPDINGVVSSVATLKDALEKQGHTVYVISNHKGTNIEMKDHILRLGGLELKKFYGYKMSSPIQIGAEKYIRDMNLDVIHVQTEAGVGIFGRQMAKQLHIPLVYTYHTMYEDYTHYLNPLDSQTVEKMGRKAVKSLSRILGNGAQAVIAPSEKTKQALLQYGVITPIYIVPTGLDLSLFDVNKLDKQKVDDIRSSLGLSQDDHVVVFVGRIAKEKSLDIPIRALSLSNDEKLHLVVVGGGTDEDYYHQIAKESRVTDRVHFLGKKPKEDIAYYYAAFDCFVSASLSETQGMTYIEALATGIPVFGRRDEVLEGLLEEGKTGYYFDDEEELVQKWEQFFSLTIQERKKMAQDCMDKTKPYSTKIFAAKALAVYEQAIDDYSHMFTVEKIKILDDFAKLTLKRDRDEEAVSLMIPMDDYFDLKVALNTDLDAYVVEDYLGMQDYYKAYSALKKKVLQSDYSSKQIKDIAVKKYFLSLDEADLIVEEFERRNWINDQAYALDKAQVWASYGYGKKKIERKLYEAGILEKWIQEACDTLEPEAELNAALKSAQRIVGTIKEQSDRLKRQTIVNKLISKGYSIDVAKEAGNRIEFQSDEKEALALCIKKAQRMYSSTEESKRAQKIRLYCLRKGFSMMEIDEMLESE